MEFIDFEVFFEKRRVLIKKKMFEIFGITYTPDDEKNDNERIERAENIRRSL